MTSGMNDWPPNPGSTVMISTWSTSSRKGNTASRGVPGFKATPYIKFKFLMNLYIDTEVEVLENDYLLAFPDFLLQR